MAQSAGRASQEKNLPERQKKYLTQFCPSGSLWRQVNTHTTTVMNIPKDISLFADTLELDWIATGGGHDFIIRTLPDGRQLVMGDPEDSSCNPDSLDDPAIVLIYPEDWRDTCEATDVVVSFDTAEAAMVFMSSEDLSVFDIEELSSSCGSIAPEIWAVAKSFGLDWIGTGGGFDFVWKKLGGGRCAVLTARLEPGSPPALDAPASIVLFLNEDWNDDSIEIPFGTALEALNHLANVIRHDIG